MLKLLKYNWIQSYRTYGTLYLIFTLVCFLNPIFSNVRDIREILILITTVLIFTLFSFTIYNTVKLYDDSMFRKSGYLTMTLPVNTYKLILSKVINAIIWLFITSIVVIFGTTIMFSIFQRINVFIILNEILKYLFNYLSSLGTDFSIFLLSISFLVNILNFIMVLFFITTATKTKYTRKKKFIAGIIIFLVLITIDYLFKISISKGYSDVLVFTDLISFLPLYTGYYGNVDIMIRQSQLLNSIIIDILLNSFYFVALYISTAHIIDNMLEI